MSSENDIENSSDAECNSSAKALPHVLIADGDMLLCELVKYNLESEGYAIDVCHSLKEWLESEPRGYSLIIIDTATLGREGVAIESNLRQNLNIVNTPLIFTSSSASEDDMVNALEAGADAYLRKPFSMREMLARINAVMRRYQKKPAPSNPKRVCHDDLCVNLQMREATMADEPIDLTMQECQLLGFLMLNRNKLYSAAEIVNALWPGSKQFGDAHSNVTEMVDSIRKQIGCYAFNLVADDCFSYTYVE